MWSQWKDDPERPLTAILTLNTIAHTVGALGVGAEVQTQFGGGTIVHVAAAVLTLAILLLSEILPKTIGALYWRKLTIPSARIMKAMMFALWIIVKPIEITRSLLPAVETETVTRNELSVLADIAEETDVIEEDEEAVIQNLLRLREIMVSDIMTPRVVVTSLSVNDTVSDVLERIPIMVHGRMPVTGGNIDDVTGVVLRSEILRRAAVDDYGKKMSEISMPVDVCNHNDSVDRALDILLETKSQILIVKDEFGGTEGLVTMEDVIETLLGVEIVDESDQLAIDEGSHHEDMRELAKQRIEESE